MSLQRAAGHPLRAPRAIVLEFGIITLMLVGVYLWQRLARDFLSSLIGPPTMFDGLLFSGLVNGGILIGGILLLVGAYARIREIDIGLRLPSTGDLPVVGLAVLTPIVFVGVTKLVGALTDVPYNALTMTSIAADTPLWPILVVLGLGIFVGVPALVVICQVLVQGTLEQIVGADWAIGLTIAVAGFVMVSGTDGLAAVPDRGKLAEAIVFVLVLGLALYGRERLEHRRLQYLAYLPAIVFSVLVVISGITSIEHVAGGIFAVTQLVVLGVAAYSYDRTGSLVSPALAYTAFLISNRTIVVVFEAGMQSW